MTERNAYRIPDDGRHRTINFSGGRSSGYMTDHILRAHGGALPPNTEIVFCNTGAENPATLDFVYDFEIHRQVPITWLEFWHDDSAKGVRGQPKKKVKVVDYKSAAREHEPFEALIKAGRFLPNKVRRKCTQELKIRSVERYLRSRGHDPRHCIRILGFRFDEPHRWGKAVFGDCNREWPMVHAGVTKADVMAHWKRQPFDLAISANEGNCVMCFMKSEAALRHLKQKHPDEAKWWEKMEDDLQATFVKGRSYRDLKSRTEFDLEDTAGPTCDFCHD